MNKRLAAGLIVCMAQGAVAGDAPAWKLPEADGQKWAARVTKAVGRETWVVEVEGNAIAVRRKAPVAVARVLPGAPPDARPMADGEKTLRFVLRFGPRMSVDEFDRLAAVNAASEKEYDRLHRAVGLPHKFDDFIAKTPEEKERVRVFREAVARLPRHDLPDLYTPDHSVRVTRPLDSFSFPAEAGVAAECREVEEALLRLFGVYDPTVAREGRGVGTYIAEPRP